jgi:hypothetical protein
MHSVAGQLGGAFNTALLCLNEGADAVEDRNDIFNGIVSAAAAGVVR